MIYYTQCHIKYSKTFSYTYLINDFSDRSFVITISDFLIFYSVFIYASILFNIYSSVKPLLSFTLFNIYINYYLFITSS